MPKPSPAPDRGFVDEALGLAKALALQAGALLRDFRASGSFEVSLKAPLDLLTTADIACDDLIRKGILERFPHHSILSEESSPHTPREELASGIWWIIDPIDGTVNFASGQPSVGVSIGFMVEGRVEAGVVYAPFFDELFTAQRGKGSFMNGRQLACVDRPELSRALVATGFPADRSQLSLMMKRVEVVLSSCQDLRRLGAASIDVAWIAAGRHAAYYESVHPWDIAAAGLIAREAGAIVGVTGESERNRHLPQDLWCGEYLAAVPSIFSELQNRLRFSS